jgi:hypothetical protein
VQAQRTAKPSAAATGYAWRRSGSKSRQPPIEIFEQFIEPWCKPANTHSLLICPSVRIDARTVGVMLSVGQYEPSKLGYERVNVHLSSRMHNFDLNGKTPDTHNRCR